MSTKTATNTRTTTTTTAPTKAASRKTAAPSSKKDFTASFQKSVPYVVVVLVSMLAYYALYQDPSAKSQDIVDMLSGKAVDVYANMMQWGESFTNDNKIPEIQVEDFVPAADVVPEEQAPAVEEQVPEVVEQNEGDMETEQVYGTPLEGEVVYGTGDAVLEDLESRFPYANRDEYTHWFPNPELTGKVRDFFHKILAGEISEEYARDAFHLKPELWSKTPEFKDRADLIFHRIHFMDLEEVDRIVSKYL